MSIESIARRIAGLVGAEELVFCRQLGMSEREAAKQAFIVLDETYHRGFESDRPAFFEPARIVTGRR